MSHCTLSLLYRLYPTNCVKGDGSLELKQIIYSDTILLDANFKKRSEVFRYFADTLYEAKLISDKQDFIDGLNNKEEEISTAIGYQIAIPHIQSKSILYPIVSFVRGKHEIDWENEEKSRVKLIFLIAVPQNLINEHIQILAALSQKLMKEEIRVRLLTMEQPDEIYEILT